MIWNAIVCQNYLSGVKWLWIIKIANYKDLTLNFAELYSGRFYSGWIAPFRRSVWTKTRFNVISLLWCLFIWQRMAEEDSFLRKFHFSIKGLIALSSGKEEFGHGCFSLPVKSAVPSHTHTVLSLLVTSHDSMLRQSLKFIAFFLCHTLHVMPAAISLLFFPPIF